MAIDDGHIVLKITENAKKYALFTTTDHKAYDNLPSHDLSEVIKFWVKKYKAHNTYQWNQTVTNQCENVTYSRPPPNVTVVARNNDALHLIAQREGEAPGNRM